MRNLRILRKQVPLLAAGDDRPAAIKQLRCSERSWGGGVHLGDRADPADIAAGAVERSAQRGLAPSYWTGAFAHDDEMMEELER